ncbi:GntR family transcriptional regulator [Dactylosporangium cerinum]
MSVCHTGRVKPPGASDELASASLVELAVSRLSREILSGATDPGERLVEEQLTRRFGISRAPLREALRLLAQQGLVEHVPRRGSGWPPCPPTTSRSSTRSATSWSGTRSPPPRRTPTWPASPPP